MPVEIFRSLEFAYIQISFFFAYVFKQLLSDLNLM